MKQCDIATVERIGLPSMVLMERAALAAANVILEDYPAVKKILIVAGRGNNGGDGLAVGRLLAKAGKEVSFYQMKGTLSKEAAQQRQILLHMGFVISDIWPDEEYDMIIDALLGIGISGDVREEACSIICHMNEIRKAQENLTECYEAKRTPIICALDLPSGIDTDTGAVCKEAVKADLTVTFQYLKKAHLLYPGKEYCGRVYLRDVGIEDVLQGEQTAFTYQKKDVPSLLPPRNPSGHKGTFGKVLLFAGSTDMSGAAVLCARAILSSGAGMLKVFTAKENQMILKTLLPEAMLSKDPLEDLEWADVLVAGPGIGTAKDTAELLKKLISQVQIPLVLDADALNLLAADEACRKVVAQKGKQLPVILTPHPGEFLRLSEVSMEEYKKEREQLICSFSRKFHVILVSKDADTMVVEETAEKKNVYLNSTGNSGMATAGSGDVLTGLIGSLLAQGLDAFEAASKGVFLHGLAGDEAIKEKGAHGMLASDLIKKLWNYLE